MNRLQATQYQTNGAGVLKGADLNFEQPTEFPCDDCGGMVDLTSVIAVEIQNMDGTMERQEMTEANARALLATVGVPPPPVLCDAHPEEGPITTWR